MTNLVQDYKLILKASTPLCKNIHSYHQIRKPKRSNLEVVVLNLTAEAMSIDSECELFRIIEGTSLKSKIERSNYNRRRRKLITYKKANHKLKDISSVLIIDSSCMGDKYQMG